MWRWLMGWIQSLGFVTQSAHLFAGWAVTLTLAHFMAWWLAAILFLGVWVLPKEMLLDAAPWGENHGSPDYADALFYTIGTLIAVLVLQC